MSNNDTVSGQDAGATPGQPTPTVPSSGDQPPSPVSGVSLEDVLKKLGVLDGEIRHLKSDKDKGVAKLTREVEGITEQLVRYEELRKAGLTPQQAEREMRLDDLLSQLDAPQEAARIVPQPGVAPQAKVPSVDAQALLQAVSLDVNDPEVTAILAKGGDPSAEIVALSLRRKNPPNPAAVMSTAGGGAVGGDNIDSLTEKLQKLSLEPSKNMKEIIKTKAELAKHLPRR